MALVGYACQHCGAEPGCPASGTGRGAARYFRRRWSGAKDDRPQLSLMLDFVREGDVVMVTKLDRLAPQHSPPVGDLRYQTLSALL